MMRQAKRKKHVRTVMEAAWEQGLGKQAVNSMIGLWCRDEVFSYKLTSSNHPDDAPLNALRRMLHYP